jgi:O-antigen ligase
MLSVTVAVVLTASVYFIKHTRPMIGVGFIAAAAMVGLLAVTQSHILEDLRTAAAATQIQLLVESVGRSDESAALRQTLVQESYSLYLGGGPLGWGAASTEPALQSQQATFVKGTHDDYVAALVERGLLGVLALALLIGSLGVRVWSVVKRPLLPDFAAVVPSTGPLMGALVGVAVMATVYQVEHFRHVWALFAVVAALHVWGRQR